MLLAFPQILQNTYNPVKVVPVAEQQRRTSKRRTFVFVQPRLDTPAPKPPHAAKRRTSIALRGRPNARRSRTNPLPFSRGNTPERVQEDASRAKGQGPAPDPAAGQQAQNAPTAPARADAAVARFASGLAVRRTQSQAAANGAGGRAATPGGRTWRRAEKPAAFHAGRSTTRKAAGDSSDRRFSSIPRASNSARGFGGSSPRSSGTGCAVRGDVAERARRHPVQRAQGWKITDLTVAGPCPVDAFNNAAFGALAGRIPRSRCRRNIRLKRRSSRSRFSTTKRLSEMQECRMHECTNVGAPRVLRLLTFLFAFMHLCILAFVHLRCRP